MAPNLSAFLETLEARIAPASLIDAKTLEYKDVDGDIVHVQVTKGALDLTLFNFSDGAGAGTEILNSLNLTDVQFAGANLTISTLKIKNGPGNGLVNVGAILAAGNDLGMVKIAGGLEKITAGDNSVEKGIASLTVDSLGLFSNDHGSLVKGNIGKLTIGHDVKGSLEVTGGVEAGIGTINIGGSLIAATGGVNDGWISTTGNIGTIIIKGGIDGTNADGAYEVGISSGGKMGNVTIGGGILGGEFSNTGFLHSDLTMGTVKIGGDVKGGAGANSGEISTVGNISGINIGGSILGGAGESSGSIVSGNMVSFSSIGAITIGGSIEGSTGNASGTINAFGSLGKITINQDVTGGHGDGSGNIGTRNGGSGIITIKGALTGDAGVDSGSIEIHQDIAGVVIGESVQGGSGNQSGSIFSIAGNIGAVSIDGDLHGGSALLAGTLDALHDITSVVIKGSLLGGSGESSGSIVVGKVGNITIGHDMTAGTDAGTGNIFATGDIGNVSIGDFKNRTSGNLTGGAFESTGLIHSSTGSIGNVNIARAVIGGSEMNSGTIEAMNNIGNVSIGGAIKSTALEDGALIGGSATNTGSIWAVTGKIGNISLNGDVVGAAAKYSGLISSNMGIGSVSIHGSLRGGTGADSGSIETSSSEHDGAPNTGSGNIGAVLITGDAVGNSALRTGAVIAWNGTVSSLTVNGSITGGSGLYSAMMYGSIGFGKATVGHDVIGGTGNYSARIATEVDVTLDRVVKEGVTTGSPNGNGDTTTYLNVTGGVMGSVTIGGKLQGGDGDNSGTIFSGKSMGSVSIQGSVTGGEGEQSGSITIGRNNTQNAIGNPLDGNVNTNFYIGTSANKIASVSIGGNLIGGDGNESGRIGTAINFEAATGGYVVTGGALGAITVGGYIQGGDGDYSGTIYAGKSMGAVLIKGTMLGGVGLNGSTGASSGTITTSANENGLLVSATDKVTSITVNGIMGGSGPNSGNVEINGALGSLVVLGDIHGGSIDFSGRVYANSIGTAKVTGSLIGTDYSYGGSIIGNNSLGSLVISGNMQGGSNSHDASVIGSGAVLAGQIGSITVTGNIISGTLTDDTHLLYDSAAIRSASNIGSVTVGGSIVGNEDMPVYITGSTDFGGFINNNKVIGAVNIKHNVTHALILAGVDLGVYNPSGSNSTEYRHVNPFAQITSITVGGNWVASSVAAGAVPGVNGYGANDDTPSPDMVVGGTPPTWYGDFSRIGKIAISGTVSGGNPGDQYGFVAANFGPVSVNHLTVTVPGHTGAFTTADTGSLTNIQGTGVNVHRLPWIAVPAA